MHSPTSNPIPPPLPQSLAAGLDEDGDGSVGILEVLTLGTKKKRQDAEEAEVQDDTQRHQARLAREELHRRRVNSGMDTQAAGMGDCARI